MRKFQLKIGLENHIKLASQKKLFCSCDNNSKSAINENICVFCMACPGTLPVVNMNAVNMCIVLCNQLKANISAFLAFDRKHYDYPDLPKGYQITQNNYPIGTNAVIEIMGKKIRIERISLEEDAAKSIDRIDTRYLDFNRCGAPLAEVTTSPDFETTTQVIAYLKVLRHICEDSGLIDGTLSDCIRCDVNISVNDGHVSSERVEIKNVNSFYEIRQAIDYEFNRICNLMMNGEKIKRQTRFWNDDKTIDGRMKQQYSFMPEMDMPIMELKFKDIKICTLANNIQNLSNLMCKMPEYLWESIFSKCLFIARCVDISNVSIIDAKDIEILFTICKLNLINATSIYEQHNSLFRKISIDEIVKRIQNNNFEDIRTLKKSEISIMVQDIMLEFKLEENIDTAALQRFIMSKLSTRLKNCDMSSLFINLKEILNDRNEKSK